MHRWIPVVLTVLSISWSLPVFGGEWESSGAPQPPHVPEGPLSYACEIEVSNYSNPTATVLKGVHRFATAEFSSNGSASYSTKIEDFVKSPKQQSTSWAKDQSIALRFTKDWNTGVETVLLFVTAVTKSGDHKISSHSMTSAPLAQGSVSGMVSINIEKKEARAVRERQFNVRVRCTKAE